MSKIIRFDQKSSAISDYHCRELDAGIPPEKKQQALFPDSQAGADESAQYGSSPKEVLENAFVKAKQIVDSAQKFSDKKARQTRDAVAREAKDTKQRAYTDGFAKGSAEGMSKGREDGYREGLEEGHAKAKKESCKSLDELSLMIENVEKSKAKILEKFEDGLEGLAVAMAKAILKHELEIDSKAMHSIILAAMEKYRNQEWVRIYVPNKTASALLQADSSIVDELKDVSDSVKVVSAPGMSEGDCVIETSDQVINAGIDSQLKKIRQGIDEAVKADGAGSTN